jgi:hypothetical protein
MPLNQFTGKLRIRPVLREPSQYPFLLFQPNGVYWFSNSRDEEKNMKLKLTEELWKEGNMYVSYCPELDIASCGETVDLAKKNLGEVILINLEEAHRIGLLEKLLQEAGFDENQGILSNGKELVGFTPIEIAL